MLKIYKKEELLNIFARCSQKKFEGGGNYLHQYKPKEVGAEKKQQCGKKSLTLP